MAGSKSSPGADTMKLLQALFLALLATASPPVFRSGQTPAPGGTGGQRPAPPGTIRVRVRLIPVDVIVTDQQNRPVADLKQEDFQVFENGQEQQIRHFSVEKLAASPAESAEPAELRKVPTLESGSPVVAHVPDPAGTRPPPDVLQMCRRPGPLCAPEPPATGEGGGFLLQPRHGFHHRT